MGSPFRSITPDKRRMIVAAALVLVLAAFLRLYHIGWSFSDNGIDEGIMLERSLMVGKGYSLYSELPCDQAPLAFYLGGLLGGDLLDLRMLVALASLVAIGVSMLAARRAKGDIAMLTTGLLLAVDFAFLRESRLFSLDMLASAFAAFSILPFVLYLKSGSRATLVLAGLMLGLSAASKLLGVLPLLGLVLFMILERRTEAMRRRWLPDAVTLLAFSAVPLAVFMAWLGPEDMFRGMVLDQGHRGTNLGLKLSILAFFGLNLAYLLPFARLGTIWRSGPAQRALVCMTAVMLAFMVLQPLTFFHHLVLMSPALAILAGISVEDTLGANKDGTTYERSTKCAKRASRVNAPLAAFVLIGMILSAGLAGYGLAAQGRSPQYDYADLIRAHSGPGDMVIAGDPAMAALADRPTPPDAINVAYRVYPDVTLAGLEATIDDNVSVVVVCYRLNEVQGLTEYLTSEGFVLLGAGGEIPDRPVLSLFEDGLGPVYFYYRGP